MAGVEVKNVPVQGWHLGIGSDILRALAFQGVATDSAPIGISADKHYRSRASTERNNACRW